MDTNDTTTQNLLFLLMAAPIAVGGCVITDSDDDAGNATEATTNSDATDAVTDDTTAGGNATDVATTEATTEATTAATTAEDTTAGEATTTGESTGEPPNSVCQDYADLITECYSEKEGQAVLDYCPEYLQGLYDSYGEDCVSVYEDFLACLSTLTCKEFMGDACPDEQAAVTKACGGK